jgi:hypothetical protein
MKIRPESSQRLLRKGVLVQETYELFAAWEGGLSVADNLKSPFLVGTRPPDGSGRSTPRSSVVCAMWSSSVL